MKTIIFLFLILSFNIFSQSDNYTGFHKELRYENGVAQYKLVTINTPVNAGSFNNQVPFNYSDNPNNNSAIRWTYGEPVSIGDICDESGSGLYTVTGWGLNAERVSLYGNTGNSAIWEFSTDPNTNINYVAISDTGGKIVSGSYNKVNYFNRNSSTPIYSFDLSVLPESNTAGPVDITSDGKFFICCANGQAVTDSSTIFGFSQDSAIPVWKFKVGQTNAGGTRLSGIRICGSDSLAIINTYGAFYVVKTYTGQILYQGLINPTSNNGTQSPQAISGNGNYVATINYNGFVRLYQRSGNTYNLAWQHQEPPGTYYHWMTSVDISNDGQYLACGTLQFVSSSSFDGKVKLFRTSSSTPVWTYTGMGDEVQSVAFSKNGNILVASSWGDINSQFNDLLVWKVSTGSNLPIFAVNSPGSFFCSSISNNGSTVIGSGKAVHARQFGSGGELYNIFIDTNDTPVGVVNNQNTPTEFSLKQNYPNPFNPSTVIDYSIPLDEFVNITVYDVLGREAAVLINKYVKSGKYSVTFDASSLSSGIYFYKITSGSFTETKKMILQK
jgi:hypothetical protein